MRPMLPLLASLALACAAPAAQTEKTMSSPATDSTRPAPGQPAPDFSAASTSGGKLGLSSYKGKQTLVLAFFPKAFTGGWTKEMGAFRDQIAGFKAADAQVLGISKDDLETQTKFHDSLSLPFPLLADPDGAVAKAFGVDKGEYADRVTFVIGKDGIVKQVIAGREAIDPAGALNACTSH